MPVYVIDTLKPKNGLDFPVVEAVDVAVEGYSSLADAVSNFATQSAIDAINTALGTKANTSDVNTATASLQAQIDQIAQAAGTGSADTEVAQARVAADGTTYTTLKERLDAETVELKTELTNDISGIEDYLNDKFKSVNLHNKDKDIEGYYYSSSNGEKITAANTATTEFILVEQSQTIWVNKQYLSICLFDENKDFIKGYTSDSASYSFNSENAKYITVGTNPTSLATVMINYGNSSLPYEDYNLVLVTDTKEVDTARTAENGIKYSTLKERLDTENTELKSDISDIEDYLNDKFKSVNLHNKDKDIEGYYYNSNGQKIVSANTATTEFIPIEKNQTVWVNKQYLSICLFDSDKQFIRGYTSDSAPYSFNSENAAFLTVGTSASGLPTVMINYGNTALPYEDYNLVLVTDTKDADIIMQEVSALNDSLSGDLDGRLYTVNLHNKANDIEGYYYLNTNGSKVTASGTATTEFIPVEHNQTVWVNKAYLSICLFDSDKRFIKGYLSDSAPYSFDSENAEYITVGTSSTGIPTVMINYGEKAIPYEDYMCHLNKIYVDENYIISEAYSCEVGTNKQFTSLRACFEHILSLGTDYPQYLIKLSDGEYDIRNDYTNEEWDENDFIGLPAMSNIKIYHEGSKSNCIIKCISESFKSDISTLNLKDNVEIENVTIYAENIRYAVHDDYSDINYALKNQSKRVMKNVDFIAKDSWMPYGSGTQGNANWEFLNCNFINLTSEIAFSVHDSTSARTHNDTFTFESCEFIGKGNYNIRLCPAKSGCNEIVNLSHCNFNGIKVTSEFTGDNTATTVFDIRGGGNSKDYAVDYYNEHDELSIPKFADEISIRFISSSAEQKISKGDYVKLDSNNITIIQSTETDAMGIALEDIELGSYGIVKLK